MSVKLEKCEQNKAESEERIQELSDNLGKHQIQADRGKV